MQTKAVVFYRGGLAHYAVTRDNTAIRAFLIRYDGKLENAPVSIVQFDAGPALTSDSEDQQLVNQLSAIISQKMEIPSKMI